MLCYSINKFCGIMTLLYKNLIITYVHASTKYSDIIIIIIMEDIYIALHHTNTMIKALITLLPQQACVVLHIIIRFLNLHSSAYSPISCRLYALRVLSCTIQADLMPATEFNHLCGVKCVARANSRTRTHNLRITRMMP